MRLSGGGTRYSSPHNVGHSTSISILYSVNPTNDYKMFVQYSIPVKREHDFRLIHLCLTKALMFHYNPWMMNGSTGHTRFQTYYLGTLQVVMLSTLLGIEEGWPELSEAVILRIK